MRVKINGTVYLNDSLTSFRPLQAQVLFLGGLPPSTRLKRRQTTLPTSISSQLASGQQQPIGISVQLNNNNNVLEGRNFKGILQDIQVLSPFQQLINFDDNQLTQTENKLDEDGYRKVCFKVKQNKTNWTAVVVSVSSVFRPPLAFQFQELVCFI